MKLLLVEDEAFLAKTLVMGLEEQGFAVDWAPHGEMGWVMAQEPIYDLVILDLMLPDLGGLEILQRLRSRGVTVPVLLLTALGELSHRIQGLNAGADDYLPKPFDFDELLARIWALIRRSKQQPFPRLKIADFELDSKSQRVWRQGQEIHLTAKEYLLLQYLSFNAGRVISRSEIVEHIPDLSSDSNVIDVHISKLRQKIDYPFAPATVPLLHTIRGRGYLFGLSE